MREPCSILTSSGCSGELLPVGIGFGDSLFPIMPAPLPQLPCFLVWHWDAAISPAKPCPSCAASAASDNLQYARYFREKSQKQILGTLFHLLVCSASLSVPQGCVLTSLCAFLLSRRYRKQVACLAGAPTLPILPEMCSVHLAIKTWILLMGPGALKLQWSFGREVLSQASLAAGKCWGLPQGQLPAALLQPAFSAQVLPGRRLAPPQMTCFRGLPCRGVGEEP